MALFDIFKIKKFKERISELEDNLQELGYTEYKETKKAILELEEIILQYKSHSCDLETKITDLTSTIAKLEKQYSTSVKKLNKAKDLYNAIEYSLNHFQKSGENIDLTPETAALIEELAPSISLNLHCMDMRDLRKAFKENEKRIDETVDRYKGRYTTKTNRTIYDLMVIALRAELQNVLYDLKYNKLDAGVNNIKEIINKYLAIVSEGNQSIASTVVKFIGEIEYLFINAVKIEYNYYVKKEQAKQEQLAIKEQMRQEAEERKALERERKRIEAEELKYQTQIELLTSKLNTADEQEKILINAEILKIESNLANVVVQKEEIAKLEHGKAGFIYIISNLGSFGENMFKIGMTRRNNPQERIDELGDASVPFKFDVHSFIFSEDAVALEKALHSRLDNQRVNKVNLRKEFFYSSVDELEAITEEISPTAEFTRTMLAEEFKQSLSSSENYTSNFTDDFFDEET